MLIVSFINCKNELIKKNSDSSQLSQYISTNIKEKRIYCVGNSLFCVSLVARLEEKNYEFVNLYTNKRIKFHDFTFQNYESKKKQNYTVDNLVDGSIIIISKQDLNELKEFTNLNNYEYEILYESDKTQLLDDCAEFYTLLKVKQKLAFGTCN